MATTKEKFYEVRYNTKLDKLVIKKERIICKVTRAIRKYKFILTASIAFATFSCLNFYMIYSFMRILQNL